MRKLVVLTFVTLDGIMQAPGGPEEDPTGGFRYGGWAAGYWDDDLNEVMGKQLSQPFDLLLGRRTYEIFAAHWPNVKQDPFAEKLNSTRKHVVSRTMEQPGWNNSALFKGDVVKAIEDLKKMDGPELQVHGSGNLIQTLKKTILQTYSI